MNYLVIAKTYGDSHITFTTNCQTTNEAITKVMKYCGNNGYFVREIKVIEMFNRKIPVDLDEIKTFWLTVEKFKEDIDDYAYYEYEVPIDWLSEHVNDIQEFIEEYTSDESTGRYDAAAHDDVILGEHWVED